MDELIKATAREVVERLRRRDVSPLELIEASVKRIEETDGELNALPTRCFDRARDHARRLMDNPPSDPTPGYLHGLPVAIKDLTDVAGVLTTLGSPIYADNVPERSDIMVEKLEAEGALVVAKSNTPELGAGSQTFNEVFGRTCNPWNAALTPGGSSGGSAAALATGQVWLATGSDLGGSLRNPASFCGVVGFRPSPGRVAHGPSGLPFQDLAVNGPMGRTVGDTALLLDAMTGYDPRDPMSQDAPARSFVAAVDAPRAPRRVAFSPDLGIAPVDPEVAEICARAARDFEALGATVEEACPDLSGAAECFHVLRAHAFATGKGDLLDSHADLLKPEVIWNIEAGRALSVDQLGRAELTRGEIHARTTAFFETYDLLLCPASIVPPFDGAIRWPEEVAGRRLETYIDWLIICSAITLTTCPAISIPCGLTVDGKPVGLQIVGRPRGDSDVFGAAALFEQAHDLAAMVPLDPR